VCINLPEFSLLRPVEDFVFQYGTETLTVAPVAVIICAIWGKTVFLLVAASTALICYVHWDKIVQIRNSNDWFYMLIRSIAFPALCILCGIPGIAFGGLVNVGSSALEMWEHKRLQDITRNALNEVSQIKEGLQRQNQELQAQVNASQAIIARISSQLTDRGQEPQESVDYRQSLNGQLTLIVQALEQPATVQRMRKALDLQRQIAQATQTITELQTQLQAQMEEHLREGQANLDAERRFGAQIQQMVDLLAQLSRNHGG
jgi:hypothetical protein